MKHRSGVWCLHLARPNWEQAFASRRYQRTASSLAQSQWYSESNESSTVRQSDAAQRKQKEATAVSLFDSRSTTTNLDGAAVVAPSPSIFAPIFQCVRFIHISTQQFDQAVSKTSWKSPVSNTIITRFTYSILAFRC